MLRAAFGLGAALEVREVGGDDIEIAYGAAAADVGALLDERTAQNALHRAHQAALDAVDVGGDGGPAEFAARLLVARPFGGVEDGRRHGRVAGLELDQTHRCAPMGTAMAEFEVPKSMAQ